MNGILKPICTTLGYQFLSAEPILGGDISQAFHLCTDQGDLFIKLNAAENSPLFDAEASALNAIAATQTLRCPHSVAVITLGDWSAHLMEHIALRPLSNQALAGQQLAQMHLHSAPSITAPHFFGWESDNYIGHTPQLNKVYDDWLDFYRSQRLRPQLNWALKKGLSIATYEAGHKLIDNLAAFFNGRTVQPSLLHGDLWNGNIASDARGRAVLFDPASYYGDYESDLAMTELFGGFKAEFYAAYQEINPRQSGYAARKKLYNLYHVLNHYNLFGGSYAAQADQLIRQLLSELS